MRVLRLSMVLLNNNAASTLEMSITSTAQKKDRYGLHARQERIEKCIEATPAGAL
ncbi:MAG: hypothetical protein AABZ17_05800 [Nitrospirota bacterium]